MTIVYDTSIVYEPEFSDTGWFDHGAYKKPSGEGPRGWFWRDLTDDVPQTLTFFEPVFVDDDDVIYLLDGGPGTTIPQYPPGAPSTSGITVWLRAEFFDDPDVLFTPIAIRALKQSDAMLKNEVRRIR